MSRPSRRWLLSFGYDGKNFAGWARQPGRRTIEGELLAGLARRDIAIPPPGRSLDVASRTDRGVSARANALTLSSPLEPRSLLRALNGIAPDILFRTASEVGEEFRVRAALCREYRYFEPGTPRDAERWRALLPLFLQGPIDVRSFGRAIPRESPHWRELESLHLELGSGYFRLDLRARSYVWGMVRKVVGALRAAASGELSEARLGDAIAGRIRLTLPLAEPERLVLWAVEYAPGSSTAAVRLAARQGAHFDAERAAAALRGPVLSAILDGAPPPAGA
jgi:tRNA pseudouridine38-40 synthase